MTFIKNQRFDVYFDQSLLAVKRLLAGRDEFSSIMVMDFFLFMGHYDFQLCSYLTVTKSQTWPSFFNKQTSTH